MGVPVQFADDCISDGAIEQARNLKPGEVLLLENLRYYGEEEKNDAAFAARMERQLMCLSVTPSRFAPRACLG